VLVFRYLNREVLTNMLAVTFAVLLIIMSGQFVQRLDQAATGDIAANVLFQILLFRMPNFISLILPLGFFIGILLAYGRLYVESEMVVLSTSGMSPSRLLAYTSVPALLLMVLMGFNSLYLAPAGEANVERILGDPETKESFGVLLPGEFRAFNKDRQVAYVEALYSDKTRMKHVFLFSAQDIKPGEKFARVNLIVAESGKIVRNNLASDRYLELYNGYQYEGAPGIKDFKVAQFASYGVRISDHRSALVRSEERDAVPTAALFNSDKPRYQATLQWRLSLPLIIPVVALLALSLSRTNPRAGRYVKLFPAVLLYMAYLVSLQGARNAVEDQTLSPSIGLWPVHLLFFLLGLTMYYGQIWRFRLMPGVTDDKVSGPEGEPQP
jgi:lipopolysaccharide export system permease protein